MVAAGRLLVSSMISYIDMIKSRNERLEAGIAMQSMDQVRQEDFAGGPLLFHLFHAACRMLNRRRFHLSLGLAKLVPP
jgi:hypothetical protein